MTEMVKPLRALVDIKKYKRTKQLLWTEETEAAFHFCRAAVSNCKELYFLEDTATPILQTDAFDYSIGGYMYMVTNGQVRVIRFFSKALVGAQLNWSAREKECYGIFYGVRLFEDLLDNRYFILKTDHMNLTYINVTFTGKVLRWKLYLQGLRPLPCTRQRGTPVRTRRSVEVMREQHTSTTNISGTGDSCTRSKDGTAFGGRRTIKEGP